MDDGSGDDGAWAGGCGEDVENPDVQNSEEVITTVKLTLTPVGGGEAVTAQFRDADGEGGNPPVVTQPGALVVGTEYTATLELLNETLPEGDEERDVTGEIKEEAQEHQVFYGGTAIDQGLVGVTYADKESDYGENEGEDLPVGIRSTVSATMAGMGTMTVVLKHQPPVNDVATKTGDREAGESDVEVTFNIEVQ